MTRFQQWLNDLPETNWKQFVFTMLAVATFGLVCAIMLITLVIALRAPTNAVVSVPAIVADALDSWLLFLSAALGLGVAQFFAKRKTYAAPSPDSERADVPTTPAPATPSAPAATLVPSPVVVATHDPEKY